MSYVDPSYSGGPKMSDRGRTVWMVVILVFLMIVAWCVAQEYAPVDLIIDQGSPVMTGNFWT